MKKLYAIFAGALLVASASAQSYIFTLPGLRGTNAVVASGGVSNYATAFNPISNTRFVTIQNTFTTTNESASGSAWFLWQTSIDATNWNNVTNLSIAASGTNTAIASATLDAGMMQWIRCYTVSNAVTAPITNVVATAVYKITISQTPIDALGYPVQSGTQNGTNWANLSTNELHSPFLCGYEAPGLNADYTNANACWFSGAAVLSAAGTNTARIFLRWTNGAYAHQLPLISNHTNTLPFMVPLNSNVVYRFDAAMDTDASGYITNAIKTWK
jgi:hypothetical protein